MARRVVRNQTGLVGTGKVNYQDIYRVFDCLNPECNNFLILEENKRRNYISKENLALF